jgi:GNAT superfamily N-acetyltransferase
VIRGYLDDDKAWCRGLWRELAEWHRKIYSDPTIGGEHPEENFDKHLAKVGPEQLWVAVHNSRVVGLIGLIIKGKEAEIEPLVVSEDYRGKGIGKRLIQRAVTEARKRGARLLTIRPSGTKQKSHKILVQTRLQKPRMHRTFYGPL